MRDFEMVCKGRKYLILLSKVWWRGQDLNLRPSGYFTNTQYSVGSRKKVIEAAGNLVAQRLADEQEAQKKQVLDDLQFTRNWSSVTAEPVHLSALN